jgi:hypothetical protein
MSFSDLYEAAQLQEGRISTKWLRQAAIQYSAITKVVEQWSGVIDPAFLRGFYIEGPLGPPVQLAESEALIVLARSMCVGPTGDHWRRLILTKELMHVFDEEEEKASTPEAFDSQIERFSDPSVPVSPQFRAEGKAYWRALAVLCQNDKRLEYKTLLANSEISIEVVAATLRLPAVHVREMMRVDFEAIVDSLK